ncbi:DNA topoisomerase III [Salinicoccus jeotgali]|uniref:DNA topoisomerase 3 n=1 Tax=Salinicoccus jeotgali TaxID=381634 RepID=A0ABP7EP84_9STAP
MKKSVVIAEKPSVARDIARVLDCNKKGDGYLEGNKYIITWALGHLVTLADPESYDTKYRTWNLEELPMIPSNLRTTIIKKTNKQFNSIKRQMNRSDINEVVIATDSAREGELVARWIIDKANINKPIKRLWISSVTDKAIQEGFKNLKDGKQYENLYHAAVARSEADWYVGLNATRALTTKFNAQLSAGRVQTPTVGIIAQREEEIKNFTPRKYNEVTFKSNNGINFLWNDDKNNSRIFNKEQADNLYNKMNNHTAIINSIEKSQKKKFAPQLYDLTELQRDANKIYGFSGKQTLRIMQQLYERHKVLTYPRTDSRVISSDIVPTLKDRIKACSVSEYNKYASKLVHKTFHLPKSVVNDKAVSDHHAIIPTEEAVFIDALDTNERKIYDLVIKRFLAVLSEPFEYEQIKIIAEVSGETLVAKENLTTKLGWKEIYGEKQSNKGSNLKQGQHIKGQLLLKEGSMSPPERHTEGSLLKAMENPARYMEETDQKMTKTLKAVGGIGTVATRADVIEKLINGRYIEQRGKYLHLTKTGKQLLDLAPEDLRSASLTAEWEDKLLKIENGELEKNQFISEIKSYTKDIVQQIKNMDETFKHDNITGTKCPKCDDFMLEIENRQGKFLRCKNQSCNHKKNVYKNTNARCPNCKKRLKLYGEGDGQTFTCVCGHREKLSTFEKRRKKHQKSKVSKKDINKYINNQDNEFVNNPFAEVLSKLKE